MGKHNIDEQKQLSEPIEITLEGKDYVVRKVTTALLKEVTALGKDKDDIEAPIKQLALLLGVDSAEFREVEMRKIAKTIEVITSAINEGIEKPKNSVGTATP